MLARFPVSDNFFFNSSYLVFINCSFYPSFITFLFKGLIFLANLQQLIFNISHLNPLFIEIFLDSFVLRSLCKKLFTILEKFFEIKFSFLLIFSKFLSKSSESFSSIFLVSGIDLVKVFS